VSDLRDNILHEIPEAVVMALPPLHLALLVDDIVDLCHDEEAVSIVGVRILRQRIGGWENVEGYCKVLAAGHARKARTETRGGAL